MKKKATLFLFGIVVFIFFSAQAFAWGPHEREKRKGKFYNHAQEVMQVLQLTDAQKDNVHALIEKSRETGTGNWKKFEELQGSLREKVLTGSDSSKAEYEEIINQISELRAQRVKNRLKSWVTFVEILDSDQKEILADRLKELRKKCPKQRMHLKGYFPFP